MLRKAHAAFAKSDLPTSWQKKTNIALQHAGFTARPNFDVLVAQVIRVIVNSATTQCEEENQMHKI